MYFHLSIGPVDLSPSIIKDFQKTYFQLDEIFIKGDIVMVQHYKFSRMNVYTIVNNSIRNISLIVNL